MPFPQEILSSQPMSPQVCHPVFGRAINVVLFFFYNIGFHPISRTTKKERKEEGMKETNKKIRTIRFIRSIHKSSP